MATQNPIKVLFLSAAPSDVAHLKLDEEIRLIGRSVRRGKYRELFDIRTAPAARATDLPTELMDNSPEVVHFSGHGTKAGELLFQSEKDGASHPIPASTLARVFRQLKDKIRCVVLNACYTELQARAIADSIPCVIGMSRAVPDSTAVAFAAGFYEALAFGRSIAEAFELGLAQIEMTPNVNPKSSDIPQLLVHDGEDAKKIYLIERPKANKIKNSKEVMSPVTREASIQRVGGAIASGRNAKVVINQAGASKRRSATQEIGKVKAAGPQSEIRIEQE